MQTVCNYFSIIIVNKFYLIIQHLIFIYVTYTFICLFMMNINDKLVKIFKNVFLLHIHT